MDEKALLIFIFQREVFASCCSKFFSLRVDPIEDGKVKIGRAVSFDSIAIHPRNYIPVCTACSRN